MSPCKTVILAFPEPVAAAVVNSLNTTFRKHGLPDRAFMVDPRSVSVDVPAGAAVDIVHCALDRFNGVYSDC